MRHKFNVSLFLVYFVLNPSQKKVASPTPMCLSIKLEKHCISKHNWLSAQNKLQDYSRF